MNGKTHVIEAINSDLHSDNSSIHGLEMHGHASVEMTKTKAHGNSEGKSNDDVAQPECQDSSDTREVNTQSDSTQIVEQSTEAGENFIDPLL